MQSLDNSHTSLSSQRFALPNIAPMPEGDTLGGAKMPSLSTSTNPFRQSFKPDEANAIYISAPPGTGKSEFLKTVSDKLNELSAETGVITMYLDNEKLGMSTYERGAIMQVLGELGRSLYNDDLGAKISRASHYSGHDRLKYISDEVQGVINIGRENPLSLVVLVASPVFSYTDTNNLARFAEQREDVGGGINIIENVMMVPVSSNLDNDQADIELLNVLSQRFPLREGRHFTPYLKSLQTTIDTKNDPICEISAMMNSTREEVLATLENNPTSLLDSFRQTNAYKQREVARANSEGAGYPLLEIPVSSSKDESVEQIANSIYSIIRQSREEAIGLQG
jgi:hypothetical protein